MLRTAIKVAILAVIGGFILDTAVKFGAFKHFYKHHPGACRILNGKQKSFEDFVVTSDGIAFITAGFNFGPSRESFAEYYKKFNIKGKIVVFDFSKPKMGLKDLSIKTSKDFDLKTFSPHGISVLEDTSPKKEHLFYVVNHPANEPDRVEKFKYLPETKELVHMKSIFSDKFNTLNDLALVKEDVFYVTNYLVSTTLFWAQFEYLLPLGSVLFYNGSAASQEASYIRGPNGIVLSSDGRFLYVSEAHAGKMSIFKRYLNNNTLTLSQRLDLHTAPDNLHFSQSGNALFAGCHPIGYQAMAGMKDPEHYKAPSQVLHLPLKNGLVVEEDISEVFYDDGSLVSGSTVATIYNDLLLVGSVVDNLVLCDTNGPFKESQLLGGA